MVYNYLEIKAKIKLIYVERKRFGGRQMNEEFILRKLKRALRQIQKLIMQAVNNSEAKRYEYLFKCKRSKFWLEVSKFKKKKSLGCNKSLS